MKEWYEESKFLALEQEFAIGLPEGTIDSNEYHELLWEAYRSGVKDGRNGTSSL
jgi:hypothetical protein